MMHPVNVRRHAFGFFLCAIIATGGPASASISLGPINDFQGGTAEGWSSGFPNPNPPAVVSDGGPAGSGDGFLTVTSIGGVDAGSKLVAFNFGPDWTGDYIAASVTAILADVKNLGVSSLDMRIRLDGPGGTFVSAVPVLLAVAGGWQSVAFGLDPSDLTGGANALATLAAVSQVRLLHNPDATSIGPSSVSRLGVDNLTAVPEPSTGALLVCGVGLAVLWRHGRLPNSRTPSRSIRRHSGS